MNTDTKTQPTDQYPGAMAQLQEAETRLTAARKAASEADARVDAADSALRKAEASYSAAISAMAAGQGAALPKVTADLAAARAAQDSAEEVAELLQAPLWEAERAVFDAEAAVRKALLGDWPGRVDELKAAALAIAGPALRAWWRAERAGCAAFPSDSLPAADWLRQVAVFSDLGDAIESAPDMPTDIPHEPPLSPLLTGTQRADLRQAELRALAA